MVNYSEAVLEKTSRIPKSRSIKIIFGHFTHFFSQSTYVDLFLYAYTQLPEYPEKASRNEAKMMAIA